MPKKIHLNLLLLLVLVLFQGCGGVGINRPAREACTGSDVPSGWLRADASNPGPVASGWLGTLADPELERLVEEALAGNRNLRVAAARLKAARESVILARAGRLPSVGVGLAGSHSQTAVQDAAGDLRGFRGSEDSRLSVGASWEVDLWGRLANGHRAARADFEGEQADFRAARLALAAGVAKAWFNLTAARLQVELSEQTRESFDRNQRIVERNYRAGDVTASPLDVQFARNQLASTERGLISQRLVLEESKRSLELLAGRYPSARLAGRAELPDLTNGIPAGIPSELLMRRPDLVSAAADLVASAERADAARKGLLPSITLTAGGSSSVPSLDLLDLVSNPSVVALNVAASLAQPVYRGGALRAQARQSLALNQAAVESFSALALRAFREVESALAAEQSLTRQHAFLETEVRQANLAEAQATRDYSEGIVGYLSVLEAQRRAFNARSAMIGLRNSLLQNRIDLHLALGGEFAGDPGPLSKNHE